MTDILAVVVLVIIVATLSHFKGRDDSDPEGGHSGLMIYTDAKTGVQYVQGGIFGGLAVRVDKNGKPIVAK